MENFIREASREEGKTESEKLTEIESFLTEVMRGEILTPDGEPTPVPLRERLTAAKILLELAEKHRAAADAGTGLIVIAAGEPLPEE